MYDFSHNKDFIINISKFSQTEMVEWRKFQDLEWYARITNLEIVYIWEFRYFLTIFENTFKIMMLGANNLGENVNEMSFKRKNDFGRTIRTTAFILLLERSIIKIRLLKKRKENQNKPRQVFFTELGFFLRLNREVLIFASVNLYRMWRKSKYIWRKTEIIIFST